VTVGRADQVTSFVGTDDPDPDDATLLDLSRPPRVEIAAPLVATGYEVWAEIGGDRPVSDVIDRLNSMLAEGAHYCRGPHRQRRRVRGVRRCLPVGAPAGCRR
jgi:hypothetical protein